MISRGVACLISVVILGGCASDRAPETLDANLAASTDGVVHMLPVVDARPQQTALKIEPNGQLRQLVVAELVRRGYTVVWLDTAVSPQAATDPVEVARTAPADADLVMAVCLREVAATNVVVAESAKVELSGFMVEPASGRSVWKDRAKADAWNVGLSALPSMRSRTPFVCPYSTCSARCRSAPPRSDCSGGVLEIGAVT